MSASLLDTIEARTYLPVDCGGASQASFPIGSLSGASPRLVASPRRSRKRSRSRTRARSAPAEGDGSLAAEVEAAAARLARAQDSGAREMLGGRQLGTRGDPTKPAVICVDSSDEDTG